MEKSYDEKYKLSILRAFPIVCFTGGLGTLQQTEAKNSSNSTKPPVRHTIYTLSNRFYAFKNI